MTVQNKKPIKGYEGLYSIDANGHIYSELHNSSRRLGELKFDITCHGYAQVGLYDENGNRKRFRVHRLVAETFIPNIENLPQVNHINGNKLDNRVENLEWCTCSDNIKHAYKSGLQEKRNGERVGSHKLTSENVKEIKSMLKNSVKQSVIAEMFGVDPSTISNIKRGRNWKENA